MVVCSSLGCNGTTQPDALVAELLAAPTEIAFNGATFEAEVSAWRDFQPSAPADGRPLAVVVRVSQTFSSVGIDRIWVVYGGEVWSSSAARVDGTNDWVARDGPKWGPGVTADVVLRTQHPTFGANLLRRPAVLIGRTD